MARGWRRNRPPTPLEAGIPNIGFTIGDQQGRTDDTYTYQFAESLSIIRGKHALKVGGSYVYAAMNRRAANLTQGTLSFSPNESGYDFASFLLGYPDSSQSAQGYPAVNMRSTRFGAFFTDDWKLTPKLSVSFGFRWDYLGNPYDLLGQVRTMSFTTLYTMPNGQQIPTMQPVPRSAQAKNKIWEQAPATANRGSVSHTGPGTSG